MTTSEHGEIVGDHRLARARSRLTVPLAVVGLVLLVLICGSQAIAHQARALEERQKAATREASRLGELLDGGYAAPNEVEQKIALAASNEAQIQAMLAQGAGKSLEVSDCVQRAPFDGEVAVRFVDPGAFVRPGTGIVQVVDRSVVRLAADVPEIDFDAIPPKTPVRIKILATGKDTHGDISRRAPAADPSTRTVHFEIDLANTDRAIPVGTTAEIGVDVGEALNVTEIALLAATIRGNKATVFEVVGSKVKQVTVDVVGERAGSVFVKTDLAPGTQVVTRGRALLVDGDRVAARLEGKP